MTKLSDSLEALAEKPEQGVASRAILDRLISNPTLRPNEWRDITKLLPFKKHHIAKMLCIDPASFSRILSGKPASVAVEKLFRLIAITALMPRDNILEKFAAMQTVISLSLSPMQLVHAPEKE